MKIDYMHKDPQGIWCHAMVNIIGFIAQAVRTYQRIHHKLWKLLDWGFSTDPCAYFTDGKAKASTLSLTAAWSKGCIPCWRLWKQITSCKNLEVAQILTSAAQRGFGGDWDAKCLQCTFGGCLPNYSSDLMWFVYITFMTLIDIGNWWCESTWWEGGFVGFLLVGRPDVFFAFFCVGGCSMQYFPVFSDQHEAWCSCSHSCSCFCSFISSATLICILFGMRG